MIPNEPIFYGDAGYSGPIRIENCGLCGGYGKHEYGTCTRCRGGGLVSYPRDNCQICHGEKGGVPGNENIVDSTVMCDYCHSAHMESNHDT